MDQIFTLRRVLEHRFAFQQPTIACFVDFRAAFDSIDRESLWKIMVADGTPPKLVNLIKSYYSLTKARVRVYGEESSDFDLSTGVRQGCPLSPVLFNYAIDWIMENALLGYRGVQVSPDFWLSDIEYADDVVLLGEDVEHLQLVVNQISVYAAAVGLEINASKTKTFAVGLSTSEPTLHINNIPVESVPDFRYLGSSLLPTGQAKDEVKLRMDRARVAFLQLQNSLWRRSEISLQTKVRVYQASIRPILLYGCETWPLRCEDIRKLEAFDHWCLKIISKTKWIDRLSNAAVRQRCGGIPQLKMTIQHRRLQWFGHVLRKAETELARKVLNPSPCQGWCRRRGGQTKTWLATVKQDVEGLGLRVVYGTRRWEQTWVVLCSELATDRRTWAAAIRDISGAGLSSRRS